MLRHFHRTAHADRGAHGLDNSIDFYLQAVGFGGMILVFLFAFYYTMGGGKDVTGTSSGVSESSHLFFAVFMQAMAHMRSANAGSAKR